jgi:hypothetical protein
MDIVTGRIRPINMVEAPSVITTADHDLLPIIPNHALPIEPNASAF